jgi:retron-type reverse transcriptase
MKENVSWVRPAASKKYIFVPYFFLLPAQKKRVKKMLDKDINNFLQDISHILLQEV